MLDLENWTTPVASTWPGWQAHSNAIGQHLLEARRIVDNACRRTPNTRRYQLERLCDSALAKLDRAIAGSALDAQIMFNSTAGRALADNQARILAMLVELIVRQ